MGVQALLQLHFPNYVRDKALKTRITFIDTNADKEMAFFSAPAPKKEEIPETRDFSFAGGKPVSAASAPEKTHRKLYETVNVTYENDDDFADVRKIMEDAPARKVKNPTHFSE